ncbi:MAG: hypothetical protein JWQ21_1506 [Herminiimonas sp.]|nr:hypothetical protein [Herminiimonas sp.]
MAASVIDTKAVRHLKQPEKYPKNNNGIVWTIFSIFTRC